MRLLPFLIIIAPTMICAQQLPETEIYLFDLKESKGKVVLSNPINITNHPGYDNQPYFHPDKPIIYFSSANEEGRTDIVEYNYRTKITRKLTNTPEREYSPTVTPDKKFISCIIQRDNGAQDLGKYPIDGDAEVTIIVNNLLVGYHAWIDNESLLLFALNPVTLQLYDLKSSRGLVLADSIGRSLHRIPGKRSLSFVQKSAKKEWLIKEFVSIDQINTICSSIPSREDLTWTPAGKILMSNEEKIFWYDRVNNTWNQAEVQPFQAMKTFSRLAVNGKGNKIAVVMSE